MSRIEQLPKEILTNIFSQVKSVNNLIQCRLVCKRWDEEAVTAIFGRTVVLKSNMQSFRLYEYVYSNPNVRSLITHLHIDPQYSDIPDFALGTILDIMFTPNLQYFTGEVKNDNIFDIIVYAANRLKSCSLKEMPCIQGSSTSKYCNALLNFKDTLETIRLCEPVNSSASNHAFLWYFILELRNFENLTELCYCGSFLSLEDIDGLLEGCNHLKILTLEALLTRDNSTTDAVDWLENVEKVASLKKLTLKNECHGTLVRYLTHKYPNIQEMSICSRIRRLPPNIPTFETSMNQVIESIRSIPQKSVRLLLNHDNHFLLVVDYFIKINCTVIIEERIGRNQLLLRIEGI